MVRPRGRARWRIQFQRLTALRNDLGGIDEIWTSIGTPRWTDISFGSGSERRTAGVEQATQAAVFRVLSDSLTRTIAPRDRIVFGGQIYAITSAVPVSAGAEIEITGITDRG